MEEVFWKRFEKVILFICVFNLIKEIDFMIYVEILLEIIVFLIFRMELSMFTYLFIFLRERIFVRLNR